MEDQKICMLLVDDDPDDIYFFSEAVSKTGIPINLATVENGKLLMNYLAGNPLPDLLFLDLEMPFMNGIQCLAEIRADIKYNNLPIVIFSTSKYQKTIDKCLSLGADFYIIKPPSFLKIIEIVQQVCNKNWIAELGKNNKVITNFSDVRK